MVAACLPRHALTPTWVIQILTRTSTPSSEAQRRSLCFLRAKLIAYTVRNTSPSFALLLPKPPDPDTPCPCLPTEQVFLHGRYAFDEASSTFAVERTSPEVTLPWIPIDPLAPDLGKFPRYALARPMRVTLHAGDQLYLPAMWYHFVEQDVGWGPEGPGKGVQAAIAINHWYDVRMDGHLWSMCMLQRRLLLALDGREDEDPDSSSGEEDDEL